MERYSPQVTALITHHLNENDAYLQACLRSVLASEGVEFEVIVISDAKIPPKIEPDPRIKFIWDGQFVGVGDKWKEALRISDKNAHYFLSISDDVLISKHLIQDMTHALTGNEAILGPMSNCDSGSRYFFQSGYPRKMTLDDFEKYSSMDVLNRCASRSPLLLPQDWIGFYCVAMPKSVVEKIGALDERMECRGNDVDYCYRARQLGIPSLVHLGVFALHFGDRTIPKVTSQAQYAAADQAIREKYS